MEEKDKDELTQSTEQLLKEIEDLKNQLEYESKKHKQWKSLAMTFHDTLWELMEKYVMPQH